MNLPRQIPRRLQRNAIFLDGFTEGEAAWSRGEALEVIASLKATKVLVTQVSALLRTPLGEIVADSTWTLGPSRGELGTDYVARAHCGAKEFIASQKPETQEVVFALTFPLRKDAA